jgi:hypothetical protein
MKKKFVLLFAVLLAAFSANAENLLTNPGFNTPDTDFNNDAGVWSGTGWNQWGGNFRQRWAAHSGHAGGYFRGWQDGTGGAGVYQDVAATGGTYTFTIWMRREAAFSLNLIDVKLEWYDAGLGGLQTTFGTYSSIPADGFWHPIYVTSTFSSPGTPAWVRPVLYANWNSAGGSLAYDDAQLYAGSYTGATPRLLNTSFEHYTTNDIRGTQWTCSGDPYSTESPWNVFTWAPRFGTYGLAFKGWLTNQPSYDVAVSQVVTPGATGIYTFAGFVSREAGFLMTNAGMRIDVYDATMTNLLQSATTSFVVPATTNFIEYSVTLDITNTLAWEVRPAFFAQWVTNLDANNKALRMDDFRFFKGNYTAWAPQGLDYIYHNYTNEATASNESVPGLAGRKFYEYNYSPNSTSYVHILAPQGALQSARARFYHGNGGGAIWRPGQWLTNTVIDAGSPFHGAPASGAMTMDVWQVSFFPPANWQDGMWYSPAVTLADDGLEWWMADELNDPAVTTGYPVTNNWPNNPQRLWSQIPYDHDWFFGPTGRVTRTGVTLDWAYYNHTNYNPLTELIPYYDGTTTFMQVSYATTTTTFWVIAPKPVKELLPDESSTVLMKLAWQNPSSTLYDVQYPAMSWVANLVLNSTNQFHGLPSSGTWTVDLWRLTWQQPVDTNAASAFTNVIRVFYSPLLKANFGPDQYVTDERWLLKQIEGVTNGWGFNSYPVNPQYYGREPSGNHDWFYDNEPSSGFTDGIPNEWWVRYGIAGGGRTATNDPDADTGSNLDEYIADTDPTNNLSRFSNVVSNMDGRSVMTLQAGPPTTNSRVYDVWWKTNLMESGGWTPYDWNIQGNAGGGSVQFSVTNDAGKRFYRTGVKLP